MPTAASDGSLPDVVRSCILTQMLMNLNTRKVAFYRKFWLEISREYFMVGLER